MNTKDEWLEADGLGGFASGTVSGVRTRRYHALLLAAETPPTGRFVLVNGFDARVETRADSFWISSQYYASDVVHPDGVNRIESFTADPWPRWVYRLEDGTRIEHEIFVPHGMAMAVLAWRLLEPREDVTLHVRPFLSGRDYHFLHRENPSFRFDAEVAGERLAWQPYPGVPGVVSYANGAYSHRPDWYRNFLYEAERARGLDYLEDLASPGKLRFDLSQGEAVWILAASGHEASLPAGDSLAKAKALRAAEDARRRAFDDRLARASDSYLVRRREGKTIVAGYPWFADWGRDTFIALRGLCLATGRLDEARDILLEWAGEVSEGMLPNRFPDHGDSPEFNSVDASLWYVIAVHDYLQAAEAKGREVPRREQDTLVRAVNEILRGYARGTRYGIRLDEDGLLAAGEPGVQLTWMDAKVGDWVVTPRIGKPVEVQALWLNALQIASRFGGEWKEVLARGREAFRSRFWNEERGCLYDVVDVDHVQGQVDAAFRPNQIFAVGGLPFPLLDGERAGRVVAAVEERLLTPVGLRSLAPGEPGYAPRYEGDVRERDGAYHQGTVWPWLIGPFVEAWLEVRDRASSAVEEARSRFLAPLLRHLDEAGLGHISEIADGESPHTPRGCPFQAWSVGEAVRLDRVVLSAGRGKGDQKSKRAVVDSREAARPGDGKAQPSAKRRRTGGTQPHPSL